jgi:hypothetical protein
MNEFLMWKGQLPAMESAHLFKMRLGTKSMKLCEAKYGCVWNFIKYVAEDVTIMTL